ncbi:MAG: internal scaffolding protein [Microviridae sp.]|nr:MAG: internal scaffolding protein [Microviridae sp.]
MNAKERSDYYATENKDPSMTDQSGSNDTDINTIVKRYGTYGTMPQSNQQPVYGDVADQPTDLRDRIALIRSIPNIKAGLPKELESLTLEEVLALTPAELTSKLTPVQTATPKDETK